MQFARPCFAATNPRRFGRGPARFHAAARPASLPAYSEEARLFATTFAAGFLFVTCLIA